MMKNKLRMCAGALIAICILATCFLAIGCSKSKDGFEKILTSSEWNYYDYSGSNEVFACDEDRNFAYYCEGGSPVEGFELYNNYKYNKDKILLKGAGLSKTIEVMRYSEAHILLKIDGNIKDFYSDNPIREYYKDKDFCRKYPEIDVQYHKYIEGYSGYNTITDMDDEGVTLNVPFYDGEMNYLEKYNENYEFADDVEISYMNVKTLTSKEESKSTYEITVLDMKTLKQYTEEIAVGFIWFNEEGEVYKILLYGGTEIYS